MNNRVTWLAGARALRAALDGLARDAARLEPVTAASSSLAEVTASPIAPLVQLPDGADALATVLSRLQRPAAVDAIAARPRRGLPPRLAPPQLGGAVRPEARPAAASRPLLPVPRAEAAVERVRAAMEQGGRVAARAPGPVAGGARSLIAQVAGEDRAGRTVRRAALPEIAGLGWFTARVAGGSAATAHRLAPAAAAPAALAAAGPAPREAPLPAPRAAEPAASVVPPPSRAPARASSVAAGAPAITAAGEPVTAPAAPPRGLDGLLAWWNRKDATGEAATPAAPRAVLPAAAIAPPSVDGPTDPVRLTLPDPAPHSVARALERVLLAELRRHGVPWEET